MEQTGQGISWKDGVIVFLVLLLLAALVWLFLRPGEPARNVVFGDLGRRGLPTNAAPGGSEAIPPFSATNSISNGMEVASNVPVTNNLTEQNAPNMAPVTNGEMAAMAPSGSNVPVVGPSTNPTSENGGTASSNPPATTPPTLPPTSTTIARIPFVPEPDPWTEPAQKDSTAKLLAEAKAAHMAHLNPIPARTSELLGDDSAAPFFDPAAGSNVVFMLDASIPVTHGNSLVARREVLRALQTMTSNQLFYVVFFYAGGYEAMPSLASLPASAENVQAMTNWLFSAGYRTGADPAGAMQRVLSLVPAPDTVWLLSGSALPDNVVDNIREANATANIRINTIGFYTRDGEQGLRRMADENRGVYRYVPPPNPSSP